MQVFHWYIFLYVEKNLRLTSLQYNIRMFQLLDRHCACTPHLKLQGLVPFLLIAAITNCL